MIIATVLYNAHAVLSIMLDERPIQTSLTALQLTEAHHRARKKNTTLPMGPVGGITGCTRSTLYRFAESIGLSPTEKSMFFLGVLYAEHCARTAVEAWKALLKAATPSATMDILQEKFFLFGLSREVAARYLEQLDRRINPKPLNPNL